MLLTNDHEAVKPAQALYTRCGDIPTLLLQVGSDAAIAPPGLSLGDLSDAPEIQFQIVRTDTTVLQDTEVPLKDVGHLFEAAPDTLIVYDSARNLFAARGSAHLEPFGEAGDSPCTYRSASAFAYAYPHLYLVDMTRTQMLTYDIRSLECVDDFQAESLRQVFGLAVHEGALFGVRSIVTSSIEDSTPLLFRYDDGAETALSVTKGDVPVDWPPIPIGARIPLESDGQYLYFVIPLTDQLIRYAPTSDSFDTFSLELSSVTLPEGDDAMAMMEALNNQSEIVFGLVVLDRYLAVTSRKDQGDDAGWAIRFYDLDSLMLQGEIRVDDRVAWVDEERIRTLWIDTESDQPFRIVDHYYE